MVFKLEDLGMQNFPELDKSKFHTATQDVEVSAKVMNKFRSTAKPIYDSKSTSKDKAKKLITENELFTTVLYFLVKPVLSLVPIYLIIKNIFGPWFIVLKQIRMN